jgi:hypothetical protein
MNITESRRNEIAWLFFIKKMQGRFLSFSSVKEICEEISNELSIRNDAKLHDFVIIFLDNIFSNTLKGVWENKVVKNTSLTTAERNKIAWNILVAEKYHKGMRIGNFILRDIGNGAKKIGISPQENRVFVKCLITEVCVKIISGLK